MFDGLCRYVHKGGFALFYFFYLLHASIRRQKTPKLTMKVLILYGIKFVFLNFNFSILECFVSFVPSWQWKKKCFWLRSHSSPFSRICCYSRYPTGMYLLKVSNGNSRTRCEIYSKLPIKTPERRHWHHHSWCLYC